MELESESNVGVGVEVGVGVSQGWSQYTCMSNFDLLMEKNMTPSRS